MADWIRIQAIWLDFCYTPLLPDPGTSCWDQTTVGATFGHHLSLVSLWMSETGPSLIKKSVMYLSVHTVESFLLWLATCDEKLNQKKQILKQQSLMYLWVNMICRVFKWEMKSAHWLVESLFCPTKLTKEIFTHVFKVGTIEVWRLGSVNWTKIAVLKSTPNMFRRFGYNIPAISRRKGPHHWDLCISQTSKYRNVQVYREVVHQEKLWSRISFFNASSNVKMDRQTAAVQ